MTNWNQIKKIPEFFKHLDSHYHNHLPIIIRDLFAHWIEQHPWDNIIEEQFENYGKQFISSFIKELQAKIQSNSIDFETKNLLNNYCNQLSRTFQNPYLFIKNIKDGILIEKNLLDKLNVSKKFFLQNSIHTQHTDRILMHKFFTKSIELVSKFKSNRIDKSFILRLLAEFEIV